MTDFDALRREIEAQLAECRRLLAQSRARLDGADDDEGVAPVRVPSTRGGPSPRPDATHAQPTAPHYHLDVVGTCGGKVTIEERR